MILFPNCKINIGLRVVRRRPDGFHDIETIMAPVGWTDILEIVPAESTETRLILSGNPVDCPPEKNLVMKAYRVVKENFPEMPQVDIYLRKIVPDGAGLGGGSSDAAFTIIGLNKLFKLGMSEQKMADLASKIGSDCPFFIYNRPMLASETGTTLIEAELPEIDNILIVKPGRSVSTAEAYSGITVEGESELSLSELLKKPVGEWRNAVENTFEKTVGAILPEIEQIKQKMYYCGALYASMTGSGSAVYGIFENREKAENAARNFLDMKCLTTNVLCLR